MLGLGGYAVGKLELRSPQLCCCSTSGQTFGADALPLRGQAASWMVILMMYVGRGGRRASAGQPDSEVKLP